MGREMEDRGFEVLGYGSILAMVLEHRPLSEVLHALTALIESQTQGTVASVLLLSEDGKRLLNGAAPNLPAEFNRIVHGVEIGKGVGSCGTAAYLGERVVVSDISTHEYWLPYNALPLAAGLKSCWSEPIKSVSGKVIGTFALYHDSIKSPTGNELQFISQAGKLAALAIERSRDQRYLKLVEMVFNSMPMAFVITDDRAQILYKNPGFSAWFANLSHFDPEALLCAAQPGGLVALREALASGCSFSGEFEAEVQGGDRRQLELQVTPIDDPQGEGAIYGWLLTDVSERKAAANVIEYQANFDALTGLANRFQLFSCLNKACERSEGFTLMLMDVDRFKQVNDSLGHDTGDELLKAVARRLEALLPESAILSRLGGDEFALYLPQAPLDVGHSVAQRLVDSMAMPFDIKGCRLYSGISLGLTRYPEDGLQLEQLLSGADQAMYSAKAAGRNTWRDFTPRMQQDANREARLAGALKEAVAKEALTLVYQPIVEMEQHRIVAAEALLRWEHEGEMISPMEFIPLAESSGLIVELDSWVRSQALALIRRLGEMGLPIKISVNVSSFELWSTPLQQRFVEGLSEAVSEPQNAQTSQGQATHAPPTHAKPLDGLILEITESLLLDKNAQLVETLTGLRQQGAWIAIDDFGTGYSSLSYLANFPVDCIKLDKSFLSTLCSLGSDAEPHSGAANGGKGRALVQAIIQMSQALDLCLVAEGVETEPQLSFLKSQQVEKVQGFYFHKPMPPSALLELLKKQGPADAGVDSQAKGIKACG